MLSFELKNDKLKQDFIDIVRDVYQDNFELAISEAIENFVITKKPPNRQKMLELVEKFREENKGRKNKSKIIEDTIKRYRLEHEK